MCGIFGFMWTNPPEKSDRLALSVALATLNDERGGDSWGYATSTGKLDKGIGYFSKAKAVGDLHNFNSLIGHCRFKTTGAVAVANAHPFVHGKVIGAHNGGIFNRYELDNKYGRKFEVDSQHLIAHIAEDRWPMNDLQGYGTVEFFHQDFPNSIFLGRFANGDLAIARVVGHGLVWSSTRTHLEAALALAGLDGTYIKLSERIVYELRDGVIHRTKWRIDIGRTRSFNTTHSCQTPSNVTPYTGGLSGYAGGYNGKRNTTPYLDRSSGEGDTKYNPVGWAAEQSRFHAFYKKPYKEQEEFFVEFARRQREKNVQASKPDDVKKVEDTGTKLVCIEKKDNKSTYVHVTNTELLRKTLLQSASFIELVEASATFELTQSRNDVCEHCDDPQATTLVCNRCDGCVVCCGNTEMTKMFHFEEEIEKPQNVCLGCAVQTTLKLCDNCGECPDCCRCKLYERYLC